MNTAWKGTFTFGLVTIPIRMGVTAGTRDSMFHQMHAGCGGRIKQKRWCETCGADGVDWSQVAKGVELPDGTMAEVTAEELDQLRAWEPKTLTLLHFTPAAQVDPLLYDASYYAEPSDGGGPAYALLLSAMDDGLAAVCHMAFKDRVALAILRPRDGMFVVTTLRWPGELRTADVKVPPLGSVRPQETQMAARLIKTLTRDFNPGEHVDTFRNALVELVAAKEGTTGDTPAVPRKDPAKQYGDMMSLLKASIDAEKQKTTPRRRSRKTAA